MNSNQGGALPPGQEAFTVDRFRPEDAEGIVRLFRAVYGEHYPIRLFYDPEALRKANEEERYISIVARTPAGEIIGVNHLYPSAPCRTLYESGVGLVLKECRSLGVNKRTLGFLYNEFVPHHPHIEEVYGEAVCNHPYMQKAIRTYGFVETAIEVALMPAETYNKEGSAKGRVATLTAFRCYRPKPHRIHLPLPYEKELRWIYGRLDDAREIVPAVPETAGGGESKVRMELFDFAHVARIAVEQIGTDLGECMAAREREAVGRKAVVLQAWLNLAQPRVGRAVEILRERGYFFGGALPRWFDSDGLLMQKLLCPPDFEGIVLESDFSKALLEVIKADWRRASAGS
jgi:hypothetical protein